ncbi:MAG: hypothetical protein IPI58_04170 [Alphaproteobacteria bacterium]|nr:MAG: hypothetical protein IPI58_04170 [Alphaproteobacteria bacterium]
MRLRSAIQGLFLLYATSAGAQTSGDTQESLESKAQEAETELNVMAEGYGLRSDHPKKGDPEKYRECQASNTVIEIEDVLLMGAGNKEYKNCGDQDYTEKSMAKKVKENVQYINTILLAGTKQHSNSKQIKATGEKIRKALGKDTSRDNGCSNNPDPLTVKSRQCGGGIITPQFK